MPKIADLKRKYEGEWLAIEVTKEANGEPTEGKMVYHSSDHDELWDKIALDKRRIYVTYAGRLIEEGYAVAF